MLQSVWEGTRPQCDCGLRAARLAGGRPVWVSVTGALVGGVELARPDLDGKGTILRGAESAKGTGQGEAIGW